MHQRSATYATAKDGLVEEARDERDGDLACGAGQANVEALLDSLRSGGGVRKRRWR